MEYSADGDGWLGSHIRSCRMCEVIHKAKSLQQTSEGNSIFAIFPAPRMESNSLQATLKVMIVIYKLLNSRR